MKQLNLNQMESYNGGGCSDSLVAFGFASLAAATVVTGGLALLATGLFATTFAKVYVEC